MIAYYDQFVKTKSQKRLAELAIELAKQFATRADGYDREALFPHENFAALKKAGFVSLTVPKSYGGQEISLYEFVMVQEILAQGDASTALSIGWHLGVMMDLAERREWDESVYQALCSDVVNNNQLINRAHAELNSGNPSRGAIPDTKAIKNGNRWILNGKKSYVSMAPVLDYAIVSAIIEETGEVGGFLVPCHTDGVQIISNWNTVAMRSTRSDDLIMDHVILEHDAYVEAFPPRKPSPLAWLLHIPACYLGIAIAARNEAIRFANKYRPNNLPGPIKEIPEVRRRIGIIDLELMQARHFLYAVAERWDSETEKRPKMGIELAAVKYSATNTALKVVDEAMRIVGGQSLFMSNLLQRYYRDVRAGLHNPPSDESTLMMLADRAFEFL